MSYRPQFRLSKVYSLPCGYSSEDRIMREVFLIPNNNVLNDPKFKFGKMAEGYIGSLIAPIANLCFDCNACVPLRTNINHFSLSKSQKSLMDKSKYSFFLESPKQKNTKELHALYTKYMQQRHSDSPMLEWDLDAFKDWIESNPLLLVAYDDADKIIGYSILDRDTKFLSLDYIVFDPDYSTESIGKQLWLATMMIAQRASIEYVYVGPWAADSPKLSYKQNFRGLEAFQNGEWAPFEPQIHIEGPDYKRMLAIAGHPNLG